MASYDAIVIGGGIVGASLAYNLVKSGATTLLIDRHDPGRATDAGAGILSPITSSIQSDAWIQFGIRSFDYYASLIPNLKNEQDGETGFAVCGLLRVAVSDDELDAYDFTRNTVFARLKPDDNRIVDVTPAQAHEIFPAIADVQRAFYDRSAARVDGRLLCAALINASIRLGLQMRQGDVEGLLMRNDQVEGVLIGGENIYSAQVAIAGGAWSSRFGEQLGVQIPVEPQRGQIIHLQLDGVDTSHWSVINAFRGHYIVAWQAGRIVVGATRETGSGFAPITTAKGIRDVLDEALRVAPGLAGARLLEVRVGIRPYVADLLPVLGRIPLVENIYLATGHGASGLQLGPYSGKVIADLMLGKAISENLEPFSIQRFG